MYDKISFSFIILSAIRDSICISNGICNSSLIDESLNQQVQESISRIPSDNWIIASIKDIAYFLREHKFNEWDHRYYDEKPEENLIGFYSKFPIPPLKSLHWEVKANCHSDFYICITYLHGIIETAPYLRIDDTAVFNNEKANPLSDYILKRHNHECKEKHKYALKSGLPFDEPIEKFQWRTTATYYMCWYTMLGNPALSMIQESCDNFANCLDADFRSHNHDPRADDKLSFHCAMYSFCPDPCCPIQHIESVNICFKDKRNPCFLENTDEHSLQKECQIDRTKNQNVKDIINNRWNVTCHCRKGFEWRSVFGMCVDINECLFGNHNCNVTSQNCLNLPGTFYCVCKWDFELDMKRKDCVKRNNTINLL